MGTFKTNYLSNYSALLAEAIKADSPYDKSIQFVKDEFENMNLTDSQKATLIAQYMANITNSITNNAMSIALSLTDKDGKYDDELSILGYEKTVSSNKALASTNEASIVANKKIISDYEKDVASSTKAHKINQSQVQSDIATATKQTKIDLATAQLCKTQKECDLVQEQKVQLTAGAEFNNKIQTLKALGDTYGTAMAGSLVPSSDMWSVYFDIAEDLTSVTAPKNPSVTKVS